MKLIIASLISLLASSAFGSFPQSWINPDVSLGKSTEEAQERKFEESFSLFSKNLDTSVEQIKSDKVSKKHWYLQSIKAELGIEHVGKFGIVGAKGETAVEFVWVRTKESKELLRARHGEKKRKPVQEKQVSEDNPLSKKILESGSDSEVAAVASNYVEALYKSNKISKRGQLKQKLTEKFIQFKSIVSNLSEVPQSSPWWVYKYQLEISIEVSGTIVPGIGIGNGNRLRLEWYRYQKVNKDNKIFTPARFDAFITNLSQDLEALAVKKFDLHDYSFDAFKVGIGMGAKGNLFFAKAKGHVVGALFFRRDGNWTPRPVQPRSKAFSEMPYRLVTEDNLDGEEILRTQIRNGLSRASDMALKMLVAAEKGVRSNDAQNKVRHFDLKVLELELELFGRGYFGPVTMEGIAVSEFFLIKK